MLLPLWLFSSLHAYLDNEKRGHPDGDLSGWPLSRSTFLRRAAPGKAGKGGVFPQTHARQGSLATGIFQGTLFASFAAFFWGSRKPMRSMGCEQVVKVGFLGGGGAPRCVSMLAGGVRVTPETVPYPVPQKSTFITFQPGEKNGIYTGIAKVLLETLN